MITLTCPKCGAASTSCAVRGSRGADGVDTFLGESAHGSCGHVWEMDADGKLTVLPDPAPYVPLPRIPVFDEWAELNHIMCPSRSRFDVLREELPKCKTQAEVRSWLVREEFDRRYPILPSMRDLPNGR